MKKTILKNEPHAAQSAHPPPAVGKGAQAHLVINTMPVLVGLALAMAGILPGHALA